ncbi:winged helix-turn-helix domain-containing protein [Dactylosporangium sp. CS-047395]|uniref:winged helix-turn-helix domain-containing protein n=1 Tax=Dactylosporangium sp. CS-047395 TaxID=3239936 RepID=UPI003D908F53
MDARGLGVVRYLVVAASIRDAIVSGRYPPGSALPSEQQLYVEYECGRDTVRAALEVLRGEGLVIKRRGFAAQVAAQVERAPVPLPAGAAVGARMPLRPEAAEHGCRPQIPLLTVTDSAGLVSVYPADRVVLIAASQ